MPNFAQCFKCKMTLPRNCLKPVNAQRGNQRKRVLICTACWKKEQEKQQRREKNGPQKRR